MPVNRKTSPRKRKISPRKRKTSPRKRKTSPRKRKTSPKRISRKKRLNTSPLRRYYNRFMNEYFPDRDRFGNPINTRQTGFVDEIPVSRHLSEDINKGDTFLTEIEEREARKLTDEITKSALQKARTYLLNNREAIELAVKYRLDYFNDLETGRQKFIQERELNFIEEEKKLSSERDERLRSIHGRDSEYRFVRNLANMEEHEISGIYSDISNSWVEDTTDALDTVFPEFTI